MHRETDWTELEENFFRRGDELAEERVDDFSDLDDGARRPRGLVQKLARLRARLSAGLLPRIAPLRR